LKTGLHTAINAVISSFAIVICFVPFLLLGFKKIRQMTTFCIIGVYWFLNGFVNLPTLLLIRNEDTRNFFGRLRDYYDLADIPLVLLVFAFANTGLLRRQLLLVMMGYIAGESVLIAHKGYSSAWPIIIGVGVLVILGYSVAGLWQYLKKMEHNRFENSMAYVYAALLFGYFTYFIIYLVSFYKKAFYNEEDSVFVYYTSLLLSAAVTTMGIWSYGIRKKKVRPLTPTYSSSSS
jgi:hypothetical protein